MEEEARASHSAADMAVYPSEHVLVPLAAGGSWHTGSASAEVRKVAVLGMLGVLGLHALGCVDFYTLGVLGCSETGTKGTRVVTRGTRMLTWAPFKIQ